MRTAKLARRAAPGVALAAPMIARAQTYLPA